MRHRAAIVRIIINELIPNRLEEQFIDYIVQRKIGQLNCFEDSFEHEAISLTNWLIVRGVENPAWESKALNYVSQIHDKCPVYSAEEKVSSIRLSDGDHVCYYADCVFRND